MVSGEIMVEWKKVSRPQDVGPVKRVLGGALSNLAESAQSFGGVDRSKVEDAIRSYGGNPESFGEPRRLSGGINKLLGATSEQLQPQGFVESAAQRLLSQAPLVVAGGIGGGARGIANALGRTAVGSGAAAGVQQLGASPLTQDIVQAATELGLGIRGQNKASAKSSTRPVSPGKPKTTGLSAHKESLYEAANKSIMPGERASANSLKDSLREATQNLKHETSTNVKNIVYDAANVAEGLIDHATGRFDIANALKTKKALNKQIFESSTPNAAKSYLGEIRNGINNSFKDHGPINPSFWENLSSADRIHEAQSANRAINESISSMPLLKKLMPTTHLKNTLKKIAGNAHYLEVKPIRAYYSKIIGAAFNDSAKDIAKYGLKLDKEVEKQPESEVSTEKVEWRKIPRTQ